MEYYSSIKRWNNTICSNMDETRDYHTKWSISEKIQIPCDVTYMWNLKYGTNEPIYKIETDSYREQTCGSKGLGEEGLGVCD